MKLKNVFSLLAALVVLCVGAMAVAAPAPSQLGQSRAAIEVAKAEIPANCNLIGYTTKGDESRITFQDPDTLEYYYVKVATATSKIKEIEVKGATFVKGSTIINKTPAISSALLWLNTRSPAICCTMTKKAIIPTMKPNLLPLNLRGN